MFRSLAVSNALRASARDWSEMPRRSMAEYYASSARTNAVFEDERKVRQPKDASKNDIVRHYENDSIVM